MREIPYGWVIRYLHANGASIFFFCVYFHIARALLYTSYINKKKYSWFIGVILFLLMIITAFLGYTLVYGQMSVWAATVITNLLSTVPFVGKELVEFIWGGFSVGNPTLNRFYSFHYLLPFIIAAITLTHLIALHDAGGSNPLGISSNKALINFHPYYSLKLRYEVLLNTGNELPYGFLINTSLHLVELLSLMRLSVKYKKFYGGITY